MFLSLNRNKVAKFGEIISSEQLPSSANVKKLEKDNYIVKMKPSKKDKKAQELKDAEAQKLKDAEAQKLKDAEAQKLKDAEAQKLKDAEAKKLKDAETKKPAGK